MLLYKVAAIFLLYSLTQQATAQSQPRPTEVIVIGVVHPGNRVYNADTLNNVLMSLQPQVILFESDTLRGYFNKRGQLVKQFGLGYRIARALRIASAPAQEYTATISYLKKHPAVPVHPFDKTIPKSRKYLRAQNKADIGFWNAVSYAQLNNELTDHQNKIYDLWTVHELFFRRMMNFPLWRMNNDTTTENLRQKIAFEEKYFKQFIDSVPSLKSWAPLIEKDQQEWTSRNNIMAQNILRHINQYPCKRIIVLTGNLHRYFLLDLLSPQKKVHNFILLDLYGNELKEPVAQQATVGSR